MFDKNYRPLPSVIGIYCDYPHLRWTFRQRIRYWQSMMIELQRLSRCNYRLLLFDDACAIYDPIRNLIVCTVGYSRNMASLAYHLESLNRLYRYEKNINKVKNSIDYNDFQSLKKRYYERKR